MYYAPAHLLSQIRGQSQAVGIGAARPVSTLRLLMGYKPAEGDGKVLDCRLVARPILCTTNTPTVGRIRFVTRGSPPQRSEALEGLRPLTARDLIRAAVEVSVAIDIISSNNVPVLWPNAVAIQWLRAGDSNGKYDVIRTVAGTGLAALRDTAPTLEQHHTFYMLDTNVVPGVRYFYKLAVIGEHRAELARTGYCSTIALALPNFNVTRDETGRVLIRWDNLDWSTTALDGTPAVVVEHRNVHLLSWESAQAGQYHSPFTTNTVFGRSLVLDFGLDATAEQDKWSVKSGQERGGSRISLRREIAGPPISRFGLPLFGETSVAVQWGSPTNGNGALSLSAFLDPTWHGSGGLLPPGQSEWATRTFIWHVSRSETTTTANSYGIGRIPDLHGVVMTAAVSAVRSPLPTGLRAQVETGLVRLTWDAIQWKSADWVDGPRFVVLRGEEADVCRGAEPIVARPSRKLCSLPASTTEFVDRNVHNGSAYFYILAIEGVSRARSWCQDAGSFDCFLPVWVRGDIASGEQTVIAVPGTTGPLRVALVSQDFDRRLLEPVARQLSKCSWLHVTKAAAAGTNLTSRLQRAAVTDIELRFAQRRLRGAFQLDVWLADIAAGYSQRALTVPQAQVYTETLATDLLQEIARRYPGRTADTTNQLELAMQRLEQQAATPPVPPAPSYERGRAAELAGNPSEAARIYSACLSEAGARAALTRLLDDLPQNEQAVALQALKPLNKNVSSQRWPQPLMPMPTSRTTTSNEEFIEMPAGSVTLRFGSSGNVVCLDTTTKQSQWQYDVHPPAPYTSRGDTLMRWRGGEGVQFFPDLQVFATSFGIADGLVFLADVRGGVLHAVDLASGQLHWRYEDWTRISGPLIRPEGVWLGNAFGDLTLLEKSTGHVLHKVTHPVELEAGSFGMAPKLEAVDNWQAVAFVDFDATWNNRPRPLIGRFPVSHKVSFKDYRMTVLTGPTPPPTPATASWAEPVPELNDQTYQQLVRDEFLADRARWPTVDRDNLQIIQETRDAFEGMRRGDAETRQQFLAGRGNTYYGVALAALLVARHMPSPEYRAQWCEQLERAAGLGQLGMVYGFSEALSAIGDPQSIPSLIRALPEMPSEEAPNYYWDGRKYVLAALEQLSGEAFGLYRSRWEAWWTARGERELTGTRH